MGIKLTAAALLAGSALFTIQPSLIDNPDFSQEDLSVWEQEAAGAQITAQEAAEPIYGDVKTYGKITGRTSNYQCFAQDITDKVEKNQEYQYSFYVMLDEEDYRDAPEAQRTVEISPYVTAQGQTKYGEGVSGMTRQAVEPGEWIHFTGTYTPSWSGDVEKVVLRILEQGENWGQGEGVMGTYYVTGVELRKLEPAAESKIETDVPDLWRVVTQDLGSDDFIMGGSIVGSDLKDSGVMELVTKHYNAVTIGNELKPDSMFGYSNQRCPGTETVTLNGEDLAVPVMDYSRAENVLDYIYDWNQAHPENPIKVRGHVLVWHSQTPEWFFHEDYDASKPYVTPQEMTKRQEWYIKTMAEHFTGEDSKYRGMFYGWDVVNEAVSDGTGTYRSDSENSSWWAVYHSNEFILNAFRFANQYMDPEIDLFYNDYNECGSRKSLGILQLLKDVKAAEGTRIDGMGMQGHYQTAGDPDILEVAEAARSYAGVVDQIQFTEVDFKASPDYDGTAATQQQEDYKLARRYLSLYNIIKKIRENGVNVTGFTVWGVVDKYSWLQSANSVGGGADGAQRQCPLLFDDDYKVKLSYWAFVDPDRVMAAFPAEPSPEPDSQESQVQSSQEESVEESVEESSEESVEGSVESASPAEPQGGEADTGAGPQEEAGQEGSSHLGVGIVIVGALVLAAAGVAGVILKKKKGKK